MLPHHKLTILRNRHRVRDLRIFRDLVDTYFDQAEYDDKGGLSDWEGTQVARSRINRLLPRAVRIIQTAGIGDSATGNGDPEPTMGDVESVRNIFHARFGDQTRQRILDTIDMAIGIYEDAFYGSLLRTINPIHYATALLGFVARLPKRAFIAIGLWPEPRRTRVASGDQLARIEAAATRMSRFAEQMDKSFEDMRDQSSRQFEETAGQLVELAERLDFAERVLAQQRSPNRIGSPKTPDVQTPV